MKSKTQLHMSCKKNFKWLDLNKPKRIKIKIYVISDAQKNIPQLSFNTNGLSMEYVTKFNFLGLILDSNLNWKAHTNFISVKIARVIGLLHRLQLVFPKQILFSTYNSLNFSHMNYSLFAWETQCNKIELLQKKAVRALFFKSPIAHTEPIFKRMNQLKLTDMYTCNLLKLYYKLYRNKLPDYFDNFLPEYASIVIIFSVTSFVYRRSDVTLEKLIQNIRCITDCVI